MQKTCGTQTKGLGKSVVASSSQPSASGSVEKGRDQGLGLKKLKEQSWDRKRRKMEEQEAVAKK